MLHTVFGVLAYMDQPDRLAERHNLRMDALRLMDAASRNRLGSAREREIAASQMCAARCLLAGCAVFYYACSTAGQIIETYLTRVGL